MKAIVKNTFRGIEEDKIFEIGELFEGTKKRIEAINKVGDFLEVEEKANETASKKQNKK